MQGIKGAISKFYFGDLTTFQALKTIGPKEIIKASHQVELYDEELKCEPYKKIGIKKEDLLDKVRFG